MIIPQEPSSASELCLTIARVHALLQRRFDAALGSHHGISFSDFQLLNHLRAAPGARLRRVDLADKLGVTASGVTRSLLPLEKIGLVAREADPRDARVAYAVITATGQELLANAGVTLNLASREVLRSVPPDQVAAMAASLGALAGATPLRT
jgi:DNA-binding MarR family transcriptional regulator